MTNSSSSSSSSRPDDDVVVEAEEIIALIKAITFAYPEYGLKRIHAEITSKGVRYASIPVKRVQKHLRKLTSASTQAASDLPMAFMTIGTDNQSHRTKREGDKGPGTTPPPTTISLKDNPKVKSSKSKSLPQTSEWLPLSLDIPMTDVVTHPHQATFRFNNSTEGKNTHVHRWVSPSEYPLVTGCGDRARALFVLSYFFPQCMLPHY